MSRLARYMGTMFGSKVIVSDTFTRADSATMGNAETGQEWTPLSGDWGISSNQAYCSTTTGLQRCVVDALTSDVMVTCKLAVTATDARLLFRMSDVDNELMVLTTTSVYTLAKRVSRTYRPITTGTASPSNGDIIIIVAKGSNIKIYVNNVLDIEVTEEHNLTATKHGLCSFSAPSVRFDDFKVEEI